MKSVKLKTLWFGLVVKIKNFEFKLGGNCMNRIYTEEQINDSDLVMIDNKPVVVIPEVKAIVPDIEVVISDIVDGKQINEEDINVDDINDDININKISILD